jgi:hypothetical protein
MIALVQGRQSSVVTLLRVDLRVLDIPGVRIADGNAAALRSGRTRIYDDIRIGLSYLNWDVLDEKWTPDLQHSEKYREWKRAKSAEVLVPSRVAPEYILGL